MADRPTARRCRICRAPEHGRHKMSCDYARYPSRYPDGPVYIDAPAPKGQPIQGTGYSPAQMFGADTTGRPTASTVTDDQLEALYAERGAPAPTAQEPDVSFKKLAATAAWNVVTFIAVFTVSFILIQALKWAGS